MNITLTENSIMELLHTRVTHRPAIVLEGYHHLSITEQQQIDESYNAVYDLLMDQVIAEMSIGGAKAKLKGAVAGAKAGFQGDQNAGNVGKNTEIQSLFDDVRKNIGTIVAQHKNDLTKMGMSAEDPAMQKLASMEQAISSGGSGIEVKDSSAMAKVKQFGAEKVMPLVSKAISPVVKQVEKLYNNSGPIKDFDTKYQQLITQISEKNPQLSQTISKFSEMAKQHKGKATFVIGALTAILTATGALAAGGTAAFVVGVGLRGVYGMLAGEPPAKAFGKAAITAAVGKLVGGAVKDLFGDVAVSDADMDPNDPDSFLGDMENTTGQSEVPFDPNRSALAELQARYPDVKTFNDLLKVDPVAAREIQQQFSPTNSSTGMTMAKKKIDLLMKANKLTDAGMDSGKFVGGELQDAAGGGEAAEDAVGNTVTSKPGRMAYSIAADMGKNGGVTTISAHGVQAIIDHPELKPMFFAGEGDEVISNLQTHRKLGQLQRFLLADPNLSLDDLDNVAATLKSPGYVADNMARADEVWDAYSTALRAGGGVDPETYQTALAKYKELTGR